MSAKRRKLEHSLPSTQTVLSLEAKKQPYQIKKEQVVPQIRTKHELLVKTIAIGLNPIDWKAPDYGFGIPELPYISGRELVGKIIQPAQADGHIQHDQKVIVISTDYRDLRKAAYQEYVVANHFNVARLPSSISVEQGAATGVAFVTAMLTIGICAGLDLSKVSQGPDLLSIVKRVQPSRIPEDVREETLHGIEHKERAKSGDWLAIWGGSSTCALMINQLARRAGLRTILIVDMAKHAVSLASDHAWKADAVVDSHDPQRAIHIVKATTQGDLRFGIDATGKTTAEYLSRCLERDVKDPKRTNDGDLQTPTPPRSPPPSEGGGQAQKAHLIGLTGLPKVAAAGVVHHNVPVKLFHEVEEVGQSIVRWLEKLLAERKLLPPRVLGTVEGLDGVNAGLDRMRRREICGGRLVALLR